MGFFQRIFGTQETQKKTQKNNLQEETRQQTLPIIPIPKPAPVNMDVGYGKSKCQICGLSKSPSLACPKCFPNIGARENIIFKSDEKTQLKITQSCMPNNLDIFKLRKQNDVNGLIALLESPDVSVRRIAIGELKLLGDMRAVEPLIAVIRDQQVPHHTFPDADIYQDTCEALGSLCNPLAVEPLIDMYNKGRCHYYFEAEAVANALGKIGDPRGIDTLIKMLGHQYPEVRQAAIRALKKIKDPRAAQAVQNF